MLTEKDLYSIEKYKHLIEYYSYKQLCCSLKIIRFDILTLQTNILEKYEYSIIEKLIEFKLKIGELIMLIETESKEKNDDEKEVHILTGNISSSKPINKENVKKIREMYSSNNEDDSGDD